MEVISPLEHSRNHIEMVNEFDKLRKTLKISDHTKLGIHLSSEFLDSIQRGNNFDENCVQIVHGINAIARAQELSYVLGAYNSFTHSALAAIMFNMKKKIDESGGKQPKYIANEIFRVNPRRPGLISHLRHENASQSLSAALQKLEKSMDSCISLEKQFIERVSLILFCKYCNFKK